MLSKIGKMTQKDNIICLQGNVSQISVISLWGVFRTRDDQRTTGTTGWAWEAGYVCFSRVSVCVGRCGTSVLPAPEEEVSKNSAVEDTEELRLGEGLFGGSCITGNTMGSRHSVRTVWSVYTRGSGVCFRKHLTKDHGCHGARFSHHPAECSMRWVPSFQQWCLEAT